ncbi:protein kinase domain-containing protein [Nocardiopsis potens]|uniref:protein kinase domain-containing protein n=1 Tax=Nocardiopsis potens TaxID=1246458 RepID=UPI0003659EF5|nr:fibronectin type III domain-containing protein [Nocardiopsis potens]
MPLRRRAARKDPWKELGLHSPVLLHHGREAELYRAKGEANDAPVVVKLLTAPARGRDEIERWRMLSSQKGILSLLQQGVTSAGTPYAVMEESPRGSYADVLASSGPLAPEEAAEAGARAAEALEAVHRHGLLHHAVTPENLLWTRFGAALIDFGSALPADRPFPPAAYGPSTVGHVPPEEFRGGAPAPASDVYRLASTLWCLLAGRLPFADDGGPVAPDAYADRVLRLPAPRVPRGDVPDRLAGALAHALDPDPAARPESAARFARILRGEEEPRPRPVSLAHWADTGTGTGTRARAEDGSAEIGSGADPAGRETAAQAVAVPVAGPAPEPGGPAAGPGPGRDAEEGEADFSTAGRDRGDGPVRRMDAAESAARPPRRVLPLVALAAAAAVVALAGAAVLFTGGGEPGGGASAAAQEDGRAAEERAAEEERADDERAAEEEVARALADEADRSAEPSAAPGAPAEVEIRDGTISAALSWTPAPGADAPHYIVGGPDGRDPQTMAHAPPGASTAEVTGLNPEVDYCFRVVAVYTAEELGRSEEVCTDRGA